MISVELREGALDVAAAVAAVSRAEAGGIDLFLGTTRGEADREKGELVALEYHAYPEMAVKEMRAIAEQACRRWPVCALVAWHRLGRVALGEASVLIAVSCPHRGEAFEACRYVIDELKKLVPIWKKEQFAQDARWQGS